MFHAVQQYDVNDGNNQYTLNDGKSCYNFYCLRRRWSKSAMNSFCSCCECKKRNKEGKMFGMAWFDDEKHRRNQPTCLTINYLSTPNEIQEKFENIMDSMNMTSNRDRKRCTCASRGSERSSREPNHGSTSHENGNGHHRNAKDLVQNFDKCMEVDESTPSKTTKITNILDISRPFCTCIETSYPHNYSDSKIAFIAKILISLLLLLLVLWIMCSHFRIYPCNNRMCAQKYRFFSRCKYSKM